jgi:hypothetical protein
LKRNSKISKKKKRRRKNLTRRKVTSRTVRFVGEGGKCMPQHIPHFSECGGSEQGSCSFQVS